LNESQLKLVVIHWLVAEDQYLGVGVLPPDDAQLVVAGCRIRARYALRRPPEVAAVQGQHPRPGVIHQMKSAGQAVSLS
jgi:hypothetical protein